MRAEAAPDQPAVRAAKPESAAQVLARAGQEAWLALAAQPVVVAPPALPASADAEARVGARGLAVGAAAVRRA